MKDQIKQKSIIINGKPYIRRTELATILNISPNKLKRIFERDNKLKSSTTIRIENNFRVAYVDLNVIDYLFQKLGIVDESDTQKKNIKVEEKPQEQKVSHSKFKGAELSLRDVDKISQSLHVIDAMLLVLQKRITKLETLQKDISELHACYNSLVSRIKEIMNILNIHSGNFDVLK